MSNTFIYEQGWLVEKPEMDKPNGKFYHSMFDGSYQRDLHKYNDHIATLRRYKWDYPDPGKEMELGKHFEVVINPNGAQHHFAPNIAIPITQRTYSEQDLLEAWELGGSSAYNCVNPSVSCDFDSDKHKKDKQQYFKRFGIEIK